MCVINIGEMKVSALKKLKTSCLKAGITSGMALYRHSLVSLTLMKTVVRSFWLENYLPSAMETRPGNWLAFLTNLPGSFCQIDGLGFQSTRVGCKTSETHSSSIAPTLCIYRARVKTTFVTFCRRRGERKEKINFITAARMLTQTQRRCYCSRVCVSVCYDDDGECGARVSLSIQIMICHFQVFRD
jgi:hypothetical protein